VNPDWELVLRENPLFEYEEQVEYQEGQGLTRMLEAVSDAAETYRTATAGKKQRKQAARQQLDAITQSVRVIGVQTAVMGNGLPGAWLQVHNGSAHPLAGVQIHLACLRGSSLVASDGSCAVQVLIPPGQVVVVTCPLGAVQGGHVCFWVCCKRLFGRPVGPWVAGRKYRLGPVIPALLARDARTGLMLPIHAQFSRCP
jgi:hypothetical protein